MNDNKIQISIEFEEVKKVWRVLMDEVQKLSDKKFIEFNLGLLGREMLK